MYTLFCLFWPLTGPALLIKRARETRKEALINKAKSIIKYDFDSNYQNDRTFILNVAEDKLKFLLSAHRNKYIELNASTVEVIREELMSRNMERTLLK